jgi:3-oxoacyl-[acyl-carrier protein] reductase
VSGRVVLVTGGNRGIGLACARALAQGGDRVAVTYKTAPPAEEDPALRPIRCDVTVASEVEEAFGTIEADWGAIEVLVCSAGITDDALLLRMGEERWETVIATNLTACYRVTKRAIGPMVRARAGRIVLISSVVAAMGNAGQSNYAAAKAGLIGFGRSVAREVASRNITVNIVTPGLIATDMLGAMSPERLATFSAAVPVGRLGTAEEVAATVAFLASPAATYVTGAVVAVDGGLGMGQ